MRRGLQTAAPRGRNTCAQSRGPAGSEPRTQRELAGERCGAYAGGATRTREPRPGWVPTPPAFIPHLRGRRLAACDVRWDLERHGLRDPRAADCERPKPPEDASWRRPEHGEGMSSHPPGRLGGGAQSGAGSGAEGAGLGTGLGGLSPQGEARGLGGTALPTPGGRAAGSGTPAARVCGRLGVQEQRRVAGGRGSQRASKCATAQHRWTCARGAGALPLGSVRRSGVQAVHRLG